MIVVIVFFAGFFLACLCKPSEAFSESERRHLDQFPEVSADRIVSGEFMQDFEDYTLDQFPLREKFRNIKALVSKYILRQSDNNGIYVADGYVSKMEYPLQQESVERTGERFAYIYDRYMKGTGAKVYVSLIPDKNYFMAERDGHLALDYDEMNGILKKHMGFAQNIEIKDMLSLEDYYKTDTHWRQECITDVAQAFLDAMGTQASASYRECVLDEPFYGVYYGQAALPLPGETLSYLVSDAFSGCRVYDYEHDKEIDMYDLEKGQGKDPYELFLSGSLSLITIENPDASAEKELILFRDSFGSSLAPLLVEGYQKITLVDVRYLHPDLLGRYLTFEDQDVLFLYSTLVLNQGLVL